MTGTALIYLRVSTSAQADTDERDPEGYSIPAQRQACRHKADAMGLTVVDEYIDRGESARSADRPSLKRLLERVKQGGIDAVIVHKVDRLARNRADDVTIGLTFKAAGVQLVSCTENIDETPSGRLLHGIMASIAEFYSANLSTEIVKGCTQKARSGGTPGLAPLGYLNVRRIVDGREVRTVVVDPERAPLVRYAFEAYATGDYSLRRLHDELTEIGLTMRPTASRPSKPITLSQINGLLRNHYYIGVVTYRGERFPGRHDPLIDPDLFDRVQSILDAHNFAGERSWIHQHYLKGTLYCRRCHSRLSLTYAKGNGGTYPYFYCLGRATRRTICDLPWLPIAEVEEAVQRHYVTSVQLDEPTIATVHRNLRRDLEAMERVGRSEVDRQQEVVVGIERRRRQVATKTEEGVIPDDVGRERQSELAVQLVKAKGFLAKLEQTVLAVEDNLRVALQLVRHCGQAYAAAPPSLRRQWNHAFFERLEIDEEQVVAAKLAPPFDLLLLPAAVNHYRRSSPEPLWDVEDLVRDWEAAEHETDAVPVGVGLNKTYLVELIGLEPTTPCMPCKCSTN